MKLPFQRVPVLGAFGVFAVPARHRAGLPDLEFELPVGIPSALDVELPGTIVGVRVVEGQKGHLLVDGVTEAAA